MMHKHRISLLTFCSVMILPIITAAQGLTPPPLTQVMAENERLMEQIKSQPSQTGTLLLGDAQEFPNLTYHTVFSGSAIRIQKSHETNLWIQEAALDRGVVVTSALETASYNEATGEPQFTKKSIAEVLASTKNMPTSLINGQFFNARTQPSELSFGLKSDGIIFSAGADNRKERKHILHIRDGIAEILPYSWKYLEGTIGDFAMVNLTLANRRYTDEAIGRTYMCLKNPDAKNRSSTLLTFVAEAMSESALEHEIMKHGCEKNTTSKLDSSGSTRLWFSGKSIYGHAHKGEADRRKIPHSLLFYDAE